MSTTNNKYYSGYKLLNKKDLDGLTPEILYCVGTRRGGKTFFYSDFTFKRFIENDEKFLLLYRFNNEIYNAANNFFEDIGKNKYFDYQMYQKVLVKDKIMSLYIRTPEGEEKHCGFATSLNAADAVKRNSPFLNVVKRIFFDEFMPENNIYLPDELEKFESIYTSISREFGKQYKFIQCIFVGNAVTLLNPYFSNSDIPDRLRSNTKFLRGHGYVLEYSNIEIKDLKKSGVYRAFNSNYANYASENVYLLDDCTNIIKRPIERNQYLCTFSVINKEYAIRRYSDCLYVDQSIDRTNNLKIAADKNIKPGFCSKALRPEMIQFLRNLYNQGCFRFKNLESKTALIKLLSF